MAAPFPARPEQTDENWYAEREAWDIDVETRLGTLEDTTGVIGIAFDYENYLFAIGVDGVAYAQTDTPSGSYGAWAGPDGTAIAIGANGTRAGAYGSIAIGDNVQADTNSDNAVVIGTANEAHTINAVVIGSFSEAENYDGFGYTDIIVIGRSGKARGEYAVNVGSTSDVQGRRGISIGRSNEVYTDEGVAIGSDVQVVKGIVGIGYQSSVLGEGAIGIGYYAASVAPYSTVLGSMNDGDINIIRERALHIARDVEIRRPWFLDPDEPELTYSATDHSTGIILASPNNTRYRLEVSNAGVVSAVAVGAYDSFGWASYGVGYSFGIAIAGSDNMATLVAGGSGNLRTSSDSGVTWTARTGPGTSTWQDFAVSADGTRMVAAGYTGKNLWTSLNSGVNWTERTTPGTGPWSSVCCSADGLTIYATSTFISDKFWKSADGGVTWTKLSNTAGLPAGIGSVACSSDGLTVVVTSRETTSPFEPTIWKSTNGGTSWTQQTINWLEDPGQHGTLDGISIAGDASLIIAWSTQYRYHLTSSGGSFSEYKDGRSIGRVKLARSAPWYGIAASEESQLLWTADGGDYWEYINGSGREGGLAGWRDVAISADGTKVAAIDPSANVYTKTYTL